MMTLIFKYTLPVKMGEIRVMEPTVILVPNVVVHENKLESVSPQGLRFSEPGVGWESGFTKSF